MCETEERLYGPLLTYDQGKAVQAVLGRYLDRLRDELVSLEQNVEFALNDPGAAVACEADLSREMVYITELSDLFD